MREENTSTVSASEASFRDGTSAPDTPTPPAPSVAGHNEDPEIATDPSTYSGISRSGIYLGHNEDESPPSPYYNCGVCGDRILSNESHHCWTFEKIQVQEQFADTGDKYADFTGSEDVVARLKKPAQYPDYS